MPTLYALVVAVSEYSDPAHNLPGCANDFNTMLDLLQEQSALHGMEFEPHTLLSQQATRAAIITGFDHFKRAGKDDICLFYFSGHGSYVPVEDVFYNNSSGRNESLVCYDSRTPGGQDLVDKELAYLVHRAMHENGPRFISILDCCHSGSAFRSAEEESESSSYAKERQTSPAGYVPPAEYLGFADYEDIEGKKRPRPYPALHLAACQPHERAREINFNGQPQGIFTYCLNRELSVMNPGQSVGELMNRVNFLSHSLNANQFPELESDQTQWRDEPLLGPSGVDGAQNFFTRRFQVGFRDGKWTLGAGAQQGIKTGTPDHPTILSDEAGRKWKVRQVAASTATLEMTAGEADKSQLYAVALTQNGPSRLKIGFHPELPTKWVSLFLAEAHNYPALELVKDSDTPTNYRIDQLVDCAVLVRPGEGVPVFERVEISAGDFGIQSVKDFLAAAQSVAAWEAILALDNPSTEISDGDIRIEITVDDGNPQHLVVNEFGTEVPLHFRRNHSGTAIQPGYRIKVTNVSDYTYYLSAVYAGHNFFISNALLEKQEMAPGGELFLGPNGSDGWIFPQFDDKYHSWGITEIMERIRLVISRSEKLDTSGFNQDALPLDDKKRVRSGKDRNFAFARTQPKQDDWTVKTIPLRVILPLRETELNERMGADIQGLKIKPAPKNFKANIKLGTLITGSRSVRAPLPAALTAGQLLPLNNMGTERNLTEQLNVLELSEVEGAEEISADSPLLIQTGAKLGDEDMVIPFGYDPVSKFYYPLGYTDESGNIRIEDLPKEVVEERSLGGSIKIFFQKIVGSKLGVELDYPLLRRVEEDNQGTLVYANEDMDAIKAYINRPEVKKVVVFIHGIIGDTTTSPTLVQLLAQAQEQTFHDQFQAVLTFDYENLNTNIDETARELLQKLQALGFGKNGKKLYLFAHSMGGLVSRWMIEKEGGDKIVDQLFTFGTPHGGSPWSNVAEMFTSAVTYAINGATISNFWLAPLLGLNKLWNATQITLEEMKPSGSFIKRLNDGAEAPIPYTLIAGNTQLIRAIDPEQTKTFIQRLLYRFRKQPHYALLDLTLFKSPNDIAVSLESQQNVRGDLVRKPDAIPCDHLSYFGNKECVSLVKVFVEK